MMLGFIFSLVLGSFAVFHLLLIRSNKTTIESMETTPIRLESRAPSGDDNDQPRYRSDYNLSWRERKALRKAVSECRESEDVSLSL